jgi:anthranilate 1,2-dioxygenase small subunit
VEFTCNYVVLSSNLASDTEVYQAGHFIDRVIKADGEWKFAKKRAVFDTGRVHTLLALPI